MESSTLGEESSRFQEYLAFNRKLSEKNRVNGEDLLRSFTTKDEDNDDNDDEEDEDNDDDDDDDEDFGEVDVDDDEDDSAAAAALNTPLSFSANTTPRIVSSSSLSPKSPAAAVAQQQPSLTDAERIEKSGLLREKGNSLYTSKDYAGAVSAYTQGIDLLPRSSSTTLSTMLTNRAAAQFMRGDYSSASEDCTRAISFDPTNPKAYTRGAKASLCLGNPEEAIRLYHKAIEATTNIAAGAGGGGGGTSEALASLSKEKQEAQATHQRLGGARSALEGADYTRALSLLDILIKTCPGANFLKLMKVDALLASSNVKDADSVSKELMTVEGKRDPACLYSRARVLHYLGQSVQAEAHVTEALRLDQEHAPSAKLRRLIRKAEDLKKKANEAFKAEKWQVAIDLYTNCLDVDPRNASYNARILTNRAAAWSKLGRHSDAFEDASLAISACETWAKGYIRRGAAGVAMADLEHLQGAVRDFSKACELLNAQPETDGSKEGALREAESGLKHAKAGLKAAKRKDYYKILEVDRSCNEDTLKKAYRKAALKWHPDKHATGEPQEKLKAESMFKDVTEAYSVLSDSTKRQQFDQGMVPDGSGSMTYPDDDEPHSHHGHGHGHGRGGGGPQFRRGGMGGMGGGGGGGMDLDPELIAHLFGGMAGGGGGMRGGMPGGMRGGMGRR